MTSLIRILYVDDEPHLLSIGKLFLEKLGNFAVTTAPGATEAINLLKEESFDVIISDYQMPKMDGILFLKYLKSHKYTTPFILFTGRGREEVVIEALNDGADFYIQKGGEPQSQFAELSNKVRYAVSRRQAEDALIENEQRYRLMNDSSRDFVYSYDMAGRFISVNRSFCEAVGLDAVQMLGKNNTELGFPPNLCQELDVLHTKVYDTSTTVTGIISTQMPDGTIHEFENVSNPLYDRAGTMIGIAGIARDITERRIAENRISELNNAFFNTIHQAIYILDQEGKFIDLNGGAVAIDGYSREELIGKTLDFLSAPGRNDLPAVFGKIHKALAGEPQRFEFWGMRKTHEIFPKDVRLYKGRYFNTDVIIAVGTDISENKKAEEKLRESEERFRLISENSPDHIFIQDDNFRYVWVLNPQMGLQPEDMVGKTDYDILSKDDADKLTAIKRHILESGERVSYKTSLIAKTGESEFFEGVYIPKWNKEGDIDGLMGYFKNITGQKNTEAAFQTLVRSMVGSTGIQSLHTITENISAWLSAECVMVGEIQSDGRNVKVLSMILDGKNIPDFFYTLKGTPCDNVAEKGFCIYPDNVIQLFPESRDLVDLNIRGYAGTPLINSEGETIGILCALFRSPIKNCQTVQKIMDIIAVKAAAEIDRMQIVDSLRESEERFRSLLQHVPSISVQGYSMDGITQYWNEASEELYGYTAEEAIGQNLVDLVIPPEMQEDVRNAMKYMAETGQPIPASELQLMKKDRSRIVVFSSHAIIKRSGSEPELFCIDIDLTEQKRTEEALLEANQKLRLLTGLTRHDIFNQINAGQLYLDLALKKPNSIEVEHYISQAYEASRRIESIIGFTREYENFGTASSGWLNLREIVDSAIIEISLGIATIEYQIPENIEVYADPILRKVFTTLIENATRHGGSIRCIRFSYYKNEDSIVIICADDGIGIKEGEKELIFDHGYGKHTGIGLFLAREILSITGLTIRECGEPGKGARFEIMVPAGKYRIHSLGV